MYPSTFSFSETHGKHRNPDEIREMERQKLILQARAYRYGDPLNVKDEFQVKTPHTQKDALQRGTPKNVFVMLRLFLSVFSIFSPNK